MPSQTCSSPAGPCSPEPASPLHGHAVAVTGEPHHGGRARRPTRTRSSAPRTRVVDLRRRAALPRLPGRAHPPGRRRRRDAAVQPHRGDGCRRHRRPRRAPTPTRTPTSRGSSAADGRWTTSRAARRSAALLDAVVPDRPVLLLSRDHHSTWVEHGRDPARRHRRVDARSRPTGASSARPTASRPARSTRARASCSPASGPPHRRRTRLPGLLARAARAARARHHRAGRTRWSAASIGVIADPLDAYRRALDEGTLRRARRRRPVVGARRRHRAGRADDRPSRRGRGARSRRPAARSASTKIMVDGVAENQTAAMLTPYRDAHGHATHNSGLSFVDPELLPRATSPHSMPPACRCTSTRSATAPCARRSTRSRRPARPTVRATAATTSRTCRSSTRPTCRDSPSSTPSPTSRRCGRPTSRSSTSSRCPFLRDGAEARHYPFGDLVRARARLAAGSDWPVSSADPMDAIHIAVNRVAPGSDAGRSAATHQRLDLATAMAAYTSGIGLREPPRARHRPHPRGLPREPRRARPRPVLAPRRRDPPLHRRVHLDRGRARLPPHRPTAEEAP